VPDWALGELGSPGVPQPSRGSVALLDQAVVEVASVVTEVFGFASDHSPRLLPGLWSEKESYSGSGRTHSQHCTQIAHNFSDLHW